MPLIQEGTLNFNLDKQNLSSGLEKIKISEREDDLTVINKKKIIILALDVNKKGGFSDKYYLETDLLHVGFGSKALNYLNQEDKDDIINNNAIPFHIIAQAENSVEDVKNWQEKSWLVNDIYQSSDNNLVFSYLKNTAQNMSNNLLCLKMGRKAYETLTNATDSYLDYLAQKIVNYFNTTPNFNYDVNQIQATIKKEIQAQTEDLNNIFNKAVASFNNNNISEVYYNNLCSNGNYVALHAYLNRNTLHYSYTTLDEVKNATGLDLQQEPFVVYKKNKKWEKCELPVDFLYNNGICPTNNEITKEEITDFENKIIPFLKFSKLKGAEKTVALIDKKIQKIIENPFYQDVALKVALTVIPENYKPAPPPRFDTLYDIPILSQPILKKEYTNSKNNAEITLKITIDEKGKVSIVNEVNAFYLKEYEDKWKTEAKRRGLDVNITTLRQQVHLDLKRLAYENAALSFYDTFIQNTKALLSDNIASYVEAIAATQKIAKNVWAQGTINQSTWHTQNEEHTQWPGYCQFEPVIGGAQDGVIDEIVGIPLAIKGVYELATDSEKQKALKGMFTKEGMGKLYQGLKTDALATYNDPEKSEHFVGQTTVSVVAMMSGVGLFTKADKLVDGLDNITDAAQVVTNPKALQVLDDAKKITKTVADQKAINELIAEVGQETLEEASDEILDLGIKKGKKFTWQEIKAFFKRGNEFNEKVRLLDPPKYDFHEVTVEHIVDGKVKKYRLDSYNDGLEIVSRKATDFENIQLSTFEGYLKELKKKYPEGSKITAPKYPYLKDKVLKGKLKLEVPETNKLSSKLKEFEELAKKYKIEIIFEKE